MRQDGQKPVQIVTEPGWGRKQALLSHTYQLIEAVNNDSIDLFVSDNDSTDAFVGGNDSNGDGIIDSKVIIDSNNAFVSGNDSNNVFGSDNDSNNVFVSDNDSNSVFVSDNDSNNVFVGGNDSIGDGIIDNDSNSVFVGDGIIDSNGGNDSI